MMNLNSKELSESLIFPILSKLNIKRYDSGLKHGYYETAACLVVHYINQNTFV